MRQPESSLRLAHTAAAYRGRHLLNVLAKDPDGAVTCTQAASGEPVVLIDDQITDGHTIRACVETLQAAGFCVSEVYAWSSSRRNFPAPPASQPAACWLEAGSQLLGVEPRCPTHG